MLSGIYAIRLIDPAAYGALGAVTGLYAILNQWIGVRSWETTVKFLAYYDRDDDRQRMALIIRLGYTLDTAANLVCALLMALGSKWLSSHVLHNPSQWSLVLLYSLVCIATIPIGTASAILRVKQQFHSLFVIQSVTALVRLLLIMSTHWLPKDQRLAGIIGVTIITYAFESTTLWWLCRRAVGKLPRARLGRESWNQLRGARRNLAGTLMHSNVYGYLKPLYRGMDAILVTRWSDTLAAGLFIAARKLSDVVTMLSSAMQTASGPILPVLWSKGEYHKALRLTWRLAGAMALLTLVLGVLFMLVLPTFIHYWQPEYLPAMPPAQLMTASGVLLSFTAPFYTLLVSCHKPWLATVAFAVTCFGQVVALWLLVGLRPHRDIHQTAWSAACAVFTASVLGALAHVVCTLYAVRNAQRTALSTAQCSQPELAEPSPS